jgi:hypothetical protein
VCGPNGKCTDVGCDFDEDLADRNDPKCAGTDCDDNDARVKPDQTEFFAVPRSIGGFDFNCSEAVELEHPVACLCTGYKLLVPPGDAGCGVTGPMSSCVGFYPFLCWEMDPGTTATQLCQ